MINEIAQIKFTIKELENLLAYCYTQPDRQDQIDCIKEDLANYEEQLAELKGE